MCDNLIFESHAHYDDEQFDKDRDLILSSLRENGIGYVVNVSANIDTAKKTLELSKKYPFVYGTVGVHPQEAKELDDDKILWMKELSKNEEVVAVGEIGLDYYWDQPEQNIQKKWFERQVEMAREVKLPLIIHSRDAAMDTLDMMKALKAQEIGGVIHCFSYSVEVAREFLNMGFYLGIGGVITFQNAKKLREVVKYVPLTSILLETDCPYLAPVPNRGKRNSSLNLTYVAQEIAKIKEIEYEEVVNITSSNSKSMYKIK